MTSGKSLCVLGGGSFGSALANIAAHNGYSVRLWMRNAERAEKINETHENVTYLPGIALHPGIRATTDIQEAIRGSLIVLVSIPSKSFAEVMQEARAFAEPEQYWVSTTKGIEEKRFSLMSDILKRELPDSPIGVISGPNLAKELANHALTATVVASRDSGLRDAVQDALSSDCLRVYANTDMYGVELGGALKNIYAIISGMATALRLGENTRAMLMTRSLAEMSRFAVNLGANPMTFLGLAGVGDLIVTCSSDLSRNFRVGYALAEGQELEEIIENLGEVAEGVNTTRLVHEKARELGIEMPLAAGLYKIIYEKIPVKEVVKQLMSRDQNSDVEFVLPRSGGAS